MKTKNKKTPSVVSTLTPSPALPSGFTIGLDLGDRSHYVCVLDVAGQIIHEGPIPNDRVALTLLLTQYPAATVALEAGTHSPWISRYLTGLGATVIVANPRKLHAISRHERKCDRRDAVMLARLARSTVRKNNGKPPDLQWVFIANGKNIGQTIPSPKLKMEFRGRRLADRAIQLNQPGGAGPERGGVAAQPPQRPKSGRFQPGGIGFSLVSGRKQ